jgi:hypothetical protein
VIALHAALRTSYSRFDDVGSLEIAQEMYLYASLWLADRAWPGRLGDWDLLAFSSGSLSYNVFPFALLAHGGFPLCLPLTVVNAVFASVFIAGYLMRLTEEEAAAGEAEAETEPA